MDYPTDPALQMHPVTAKFTSGDAGAGIPPSVDSGEENNQVWDELINLISAGGLTPSNGDLTQVQQSVAAQIATAVATLVDSSPAALDTLNELALALGNDQNFATTMATALGLKANLASPALTGNPTAPTQSPGTNNTRIASTAFVTAAIAALSSVYAAAGHNHNSAYSAIGHGHGIGDVSGLQNALDAKLNLAGLSIDTLAPWSIVFPNDWNNFAIQGGFIGSVSDNTDATLNFADTFTSLLGAYAQTMVNENNAHMAHVKTAGLASMTARHHDLSAGNVAGIYFLAFGTV